MKKEKELNAEILELTMLIREKFPELVAYLDDLPGALPDGNTEIKLKNLEEYCNSLMALIENYIKEHPELIYKNKIPQ